MPVRDREAPGSNPVPPTMSCLKTSRKFFGRNGHLRDVQLNPRRQQLVATRPGSRRVHDQPRNVELAREPAVGSDSKWPPKHSTMS